MKNRNDLTNGSILMTLLAFALPFLGANFLQALYGAADLYVVGQNNGTSAISAVNIGSQIMQIITCFVTGCSMGTTVMLGRYVGCRDERRIGETIQNSLIIFSALAILLTPLMIWQADHLAVIMRTPREAMQETILYVRICSCAIPFIILFNVLAAILRGMGDSKTPMLVVGIACIINIIGDFLLTGYWKAGVAGVAVATSLAQLISSVCGFLIMRRHGIALSFQKLTIRKSIIREIASVGLPIALQDTLINFSFMLLTVIANSRGLVSSSAVGVVEKLIMFMFLVPSCMLSATSAITAQNMGAGQKARAVKSLKYAIAITAGFGLCMCALSWLFPHQLAGVFAKDDSVIIAAGEYLKTYSIDCILVAFTFCINGYLCGIEKSLITFIHNVISIFLVRIPAAYFFSKMFPDTLLPMGLASPLGSTASLLILAGYFYLSQKREKRRRTNVRQSA